MFDEVGQDWATPDEFGPSFVHSGPKVVDVRPTSEQLQPNSEQFISFEFSPMLVVSGPRRRGPAGGGGGGATTSWRSGHSGAHCVWMLCDGKCLFHGLGTDIEHRAKDLGEERVKVVGCEGENV